MDQRTLDIFVCTCKYLDSLVDEIILSRINLPQQTVLAVNQLLDKLYNFSNSCTTNGVVLESNVDGMIDTRLNQMEESLNTINKFHSKVKLEPLTNDHSSSKPDPRGSGLKNEYLFVNSKLPQSNEVYNQLFRSTTSSSSHQSSGKSKTQTTGSETSKPIPASESLLPTVSARLVKSKTSQPAKLNTQSVSSKSETKSTKLAINSNACQSPDTNHENWLDKLFKPTIGDPNYLTSFCGVKITECFYSGMELIIAGKISSDDLGLYCCVCCVFVNCSLLDHIVNLSHEEDVLHPKHFILNYCNICNLCCFGSKRVANAYLDLHFVLLHEGRTNSSSKEAKNVFNYTGCRSETSSLSSVTSNSQDKDKRFGERQRGTSGEIQSKNQSTQKNNLPPSKPRVDLPNSTVVPVNVDTTYKKKILKSSKALEIEDKINFEKEESYSNFPKPHSPFSNAKLAKCSSNVINIKTEESNNNPVQPFSSLSAALPVSSSTNNSTAPSKYKKNDLKTEQTSVTQAPPKNTNKSADKKKTGNELPDVPESSGYTELDHVFKVILQEWEVNHLVIDGGYCAVCNLGILSSFEWFSHVEDHNVVADNQWSETICPTCNIRVYGSQLEHLLTSSVHLYLDKLISKSKS